MSFAGTGGVGDRISVVEGRRVVCSATVHSDGDWTCRGRVADTHGSHTFVAVATGRNGATAQSEPVTVRIASRHRPYKGRPHTGPRDAAAAS
ncbi:Ig-like domain-containing protein [Streptomyces sp. NPDC019396]|uniref:Ig-like domain-containing protein n=1 Tax=Streptomyces sp. NPDC019396 TaxID=3154687 RepID=UPI0033DD4B9A